MFTELTAHDQEVLRGGVTTGRSTMPNGLHNRANSNWDASQGFNPGIYNSSTSAKGLQGAGSNYDMNTLQNQGGVLVTRGQSVYFGTYPSP